MPAALTQQVLTQQVPADLTQQVLTQQVPADLTRQVLTQQVPQQVLPQQVPAALAASDAKPAICEPIAPPDALRSAELPAVKPAQNPALLRFIQTYNAKTRRSKQLATDYRKVMADKRSTSGFRFSTKELVYPIIATRSQGARFWDVDHNEYIDVTMGFGTLLFGHRPAFLVEALSRQLDAGFHIGPQSDRAGRVAALISELTGMERVVFAATGSEAVMVAIRLARAKTQRSKIAIFRGAFHGNYDVTLMQPGDGDNCRPSVLGVTQGVADDVVLLRYGDDSALAYLARHGHTLAGVLVEPFQSRNPGLKPKAFVQELRRITRELGVPLIIDEVLPGFRVHQGGAQAWYGVKADIATYGKVVANGMPIGVVAGDSAFLDYIDGGGDWHFGDASYPENDVSFTAGTYIKHPFSMAAAEAVLLRLKAQGPGLQERISRKVDRLAELVNPFFRDEHFPFELQHFGSTFRFSHKGNEDLFFYDLIARGVYVWESRVCYLSDAHTDADVEQIANTVQQSLLALRAAGLTGDARPVRTAVQAPTAPPAAPQAAAQSETLALSDTQRQLFFLGATEAQGATSYQETSLLKLQGELDPAVLERAFVQLIARHQALRTGFDADGEQQTIYPQAPFALTQIAVAGTPEAQAARCHELAAAAGRVPFDLAQPPLLRAQLLRLGPTDHRLILTTHDLVVDGLSIGVLVRDLVELYRAEQTGSAPRLSPNLQLKDYVGWLSERQKSEGYAAAREFWMGQLEGRAHPCELPLDRPRPRRSDQPGSRTFRTLSPTLWEQIHRTAAALRVSDFVFCFAGFTHFLYHLTRQASFIVGVRASVRGLDGASTLVANTTNLLAIPCGKPVGSRLAEHCKATQLTFLDAFEHHEYPYTALIKDLNLPRDPSRPPLVAVVFNLDTDALVGSTGSGLEAELLAYPMERGRLDLEVNITQSGGGLRVDFEYRADLFDDPTIARWLDAYVEFLKRSAGSPELTLDALGCDLSTVDAPSATASELAAALESQLQANPLREAARCSGVSLTYGELAQQSAHLAAHLLALGSERGAFVGILMERGIAMLVALVACVRSGRVFIPLDLAWPASRLQETLGDAGIALAITDAAGALALAGTACRAVIWDAAAASAAPAESAPGSEPTSEPSVPLTASDLAYAIYTSGSTGKPKAALIQHDGMWNHLQAKIEDLALRETDVVAQTAPHCFDIAVWQFFAPLLIGGQVEIVPTATVRSPRQLLAALDSGGVTVFQVVPSLLRELLEELTSDATVQLPARLRWLIATGEALPPDLCRSWLTRYPEIPLMNAYGPTECSDDVTHHVVREVPAAHVTSIPIGKAIRNLRAHVLDAARCPVPQGEKGELWIEGVSVGRGYLNRPELTAQSFVWVQLPDAPAPRRMYRTGDVVREREDGVLEFFGRADHQVKVRGHRIELGEIEAVLAQHEGIRQAVVLAETDAQGATLLVAYFCSPLGAEGAPLAAPSAAELRAFLGERLPPYMVPHHLVPLPTIPLTANGKVDRRACQQLAGPLARTVQAAPQPTSDERPLQLARIFAEVLGLANVGLDDNFFELGGDSILSLKVARLARQAGLAFDPNDLFEHQTVRALCAATALAAQSADRANPAPGAGASRLAAHPTADEAPLTPAQEWFFAEDLAEPTRWCQSYTVTLAPGVEREPLRRALTALPARHPALRTAFTSDPKTRRQCLQATAPVQILELERSTLAPALLPQQLAAAKEELQAGFEFHTPRLLGALLVWGAADQPGELYLVAHHLAVDMVSWWILLEDVRALYAAALAGQDLAACPAPEGTSFLAWSQHLAEHASSEAIAQELEFWQQTSADKAAAPTRFGLPRERPQIGELRRVEVSFTAAHTEELLREFPKRTQLRVDILLLTALARAWATVSDAPELVLDLEGHGREPLSAGLDVAQTVGFFTAVFPVRLAADPTADPRTDLAQIAGRIDGIPRRGLGWGLLRHGASQQEVLAHGAPRQICFNYLGQLDRLVPTAAPFCGQGSFEWMVRSPRQHAPYALEIEALVQQGALRLVFVFAPTVFAPAQIEDLAKSCQAAVLALLEAVVDSGLPRGLPTGEPLGERLAKPIAAGGETPDWVQEFGSAELQQLRSALSAADLGG